MPKETSKKVAKIASKAVKGKRLTKQEKKSLGASALTQAEEDPIIGGTAAWVIVGTNKNGAVRLVDPMLYHTRRDAKTVLLHEGEKVVKAAVLFLR